MVHMKKKSLNKKNIGGKTVNQEILHPVKLPSEIKEG